MDIQDLRIFTEAAREGSISRTAERNQFVQSTVTNKIKKMESHFGTTLFYRHNNGIRLTPSGRQLLPIAEEILRLYQDAREILNPEKAPGGTLRIGSMETTAAIHLPVLLSHFHQMYPDVELILETGPTEILLDKIRLHELDGAFLVEVPETASLQRASLSMEKLYLLSRKEIRKENLETENSIVFKKGCSYRRHFEAWLASENISRRRILEFGSLETIIGCLQAGLGHTVLPLSLVEQKELKKNFPPLFMEPLPERFGHLHTVFAYRDTPSPCRILSAFADTVRSFSQNNQPKK